MRERRRKGRKEVRDGGREGVVDRNMEAYGLNCTNSL